MRKVYVLTDYLEIFDIKPFTHEEWCLERRKANKATHGKKNWLPLLDCLKDLPWHEKDNVVDKTDKPVGSFAEFMETMESQVEYVDLDEIELDV